MDHQVSFDVDKAQIQAWYAQVLGIHDPNTPEAVGWHSQESQTTRFRILSEIGPFEGNSVLDMGCGTGELAYYLMNFDQRVGSYGGWDINPHAIYIARSRQKGMFHVRDILTAPPEDQDFDYVMSSGIFNLKTDHSWELTVAMLQAMFKACKIGMAVNFLSALSPRKHDENSFYYDPSMVFSEVSKLTPWVTLRHDYRDNDFTIYAYRGPHV